VPTAKLSTLLKELVIAGFQTPAGGFVGSSHAEIAELESAFLSVCTLFATVFCTIFVSLDSQITLKVESPLADF